MQIKLQAPLSSCVAMAPNLLDFHTGGGVARGGVLARGGVRFRPARPGLEEVAVAPFSDAPARRLVNKSRTCSYIFQRTCTRPAYVFSSFSAPLTAKTWAIARDTMPASPLSPAMAWVFPLPVAPYAITHP